MNDEEIVKVVKALTGDITPIQPERRNVKGIKNISVCKGCKYFLENSSYTYLDKTCNFIEMTGKSRILIEKQNGGVKRDSCVCYEKKQGSKQDGK